MRARVSAVVRPGRLGRRVGGPVRALGLVAAALALLAPASGRAQAPLERDIDVAHLRTAPGPDPLLGGEGTALAPPGRVFLGATLSWLDRPLVVASPSGAVDAALVRGRLGLDLGLAVGVASWLELGAVLPLVLHQGGDGEVRGVELPPLASAGLADLRLRAKVSLLSSARDGFGVGFVVEGSADTAVRGGFAGNDGFGLQAMLLADFRLLGWHLALAAGYRVRPRRELGDLTVDDEIVWSVAGRAPLPRDLAVLVQAQGAHGVLGPDGAFGAQDENPVLLHLGLELPALGDLRAVLGGGLGVTSGYGAPRFDLFLQVRYGPRNRDTDGDGVLDHLDLCPDIPEDHDGFEDEDGCPDEDNDGDGVLDLLDLCPLEPEDHDGFEDEDGCPDPDNDGDGILDEDDRCPDEAGEPDPGGERHGCPPSDEPEDRDVALETDTDGDGVPDDRDHCPLEPEDLDGHEDDDGCPDQDDGGVLLPDEDDRGPGEPEEPERGEGGDGGSDGPAEGAGTR